MSPSKRRAYRGAGSRESWSCYIERYPLLASHLVAEYFTEIAPRVAGQLLADAYAERLGRGRKKPCPESPRAMLEQAIRNRRAHSGALYEVCRAVFGVPLDAEDAGALRAAEHSPGLIRVISTEISPSYNASGQLLSGPEIAGPYLSELIGAKDREHFVVLHLDTRHRVIASETIAIGSLTQALVHPRETFKAAVRNNSAGVICGHNHPSGELSPSREDHAIHQRLSRVGELLGIPVLDFVIVSRSGYCSLPSPSSTSGERY